MAMALQMKSYGEYEALRDSLLARASSTEQGGSTGVAETTKDDDEEEGTEQRPK